MKKLTDEEIGEGMEQLARMVQDIKKTLYEAEQAGVVYQLSETEQKMLYEAEQAVLIYQRSQGEESLYGKAITDYLNNK